MGEVAVRRKVRRLTLAVSALVALFPAVAGCSDSGDNKPGATIPSTPANAEGRHGPFFPQCGGVSDQRALTDPLTDRCHPTRHGVGLTAADKIDHLPRTTP
ncbi:predicted protein [Mycobacterium tuberculosis T17]|nr:predicted protein [Mycobacterium tuberculosis T17]